MKTTNFGFPKPEADEFYDVAEFGKAMDMLDSKLYEVLTKIDTANKHITNKENPHEVTKKQIGLGNIENKSSATIRGELTKENVNKALGYTAVSQNDLRTATKNIGKILSLADSKYKNMFYYEEHMQFSKENDNTLIGYTKKIDDAIKESGGTWNYNVKCFVYYPNKNGITFEAFTVNSGDYAGKIKVTEYISNNESFSSIGVKMFIMTE